MFGTSFMERKSREVYQNGTAFRSFANFDHPNLSHRESMEDCTIRPIKNRSSMIVSSKIVQSLLSLEYSTATEGRT